MQLSQMVPKGTQKTFEWLNGMHATHLLESEVCN